MRTDDFLLKFSEEHLAYELEMFFVSAAECLLKEPESISIKNALIESFTIHARSILFFFYPTGRIKPDDALAEHFFPAGKEWEAVRPEMPESLAVLQKRVNKEIAHLTYTRMDRPKAGWHFPMVMRDIFLVLVVFVEEADPAKLHPNFIRVASTWLDLFIARGVYTNTGVSKTDV